MQKLIQQIYSTQEDLECEKCERSHGHFISLTCDHKYCVLCLSFMYAKHRKLDPKEGTVKCIKCEQITELHPSHLEIVTSTLKQQVFPSIEEDSHAGLSKNGFSIQHSLTGTRKIKSQEHSFENNITPSSSKGFFSKCESPSSFKKQSSKMSCSVHRNETITHVCLCCNMIFLCIRCISSSKKHQNHEIKDLKKMVCMMSQQISELKMEVNNNTLEAGNRIKDLRCKQVLIRKRSERSIQEIMKIFDDLRDLIKKKQQQIIEKCHRNMQQLLVENNDEIDGIQGYVEKLGRANERMGVIEKGGDSVDSILMWEQVKQEYMKIREVGLEEGTSGKFRVVSSSFFKDIDKFCNEFGGFDVNFKEVNLCGLTDLQNCRSQSKFKKENKRLKTNFVSLNSSRDKKVFKCTKTEEDERRLRTEKVGIERDKKSSKAPAYINDYINKKAVKFGSDGSSRALESTSPNIEHSKMNSKLSKTLCPEELTKKKKDNMLQIKERMERKTTQPLSKKAELSKKKKMN